MLRIFQGGFYGASGEGAGKHRNVASDNLDANWANKIELAVVDLYSTIAGEGAYGPFRFETTSGTITEFLNGDGVTTSFRLHAYIHQHQLYDYDVSKNDPASDAISPNGYYGRLTDFDSGTRLSNTLVFLLPPPSGNKNITVTYDNYIILPSQMDGGAYLSDWLPTG